DAERIESAASLLRSSCGEQVKIAAGTDDALAQVMSGVVPSDAVTAGPFPFRVDRELAVRGAWYEFFPRSEGGFRAGAATYERLEAIAAAGFDVVYVPPIHPIGTTHRKGRNNSLVAGPGDVGSPWAIGADGGGHTSVHPDLGDLADVDRFLEAAASLGLEVALDLALQCSPDHPWVAEHPEWFTHRADGSIRTAENPPKRYEDIYPLNFWPDRDEDRVALWSACRDIVEFWVARGVRVFRVDNPHTKPLAFWEWMLADTRSRHPELVFLAEAFTSPPMMHLLGEIGFSQSYTYFTWRTEANELMEYGCELAHAVTAGWFRPNLWTNTPDILAGPLRGGSRQVFAARAVLAATMAPSWGVYSGFECCENEPAAATNEEYVNPEKYQLVQRRHDDPASLMSLIERLNTIRRAHPALWRMQSFRAERIDHPQLVAYSHRHGDDVILAVVNLDADHAHEATVGLDLWALGLPTSAPFVAEDLLTGESWNWQGADNYVRLDPAERVAHVFSLRRA
ncbi:MAG: alpha-1,4-glucan--maltose-1-phosphate maltosyltransferase, partial [Actinomycetes bacterium]